MEITVPESGGGLEIRTWGELRPEEREQIARSELQELAPVEAWTARGTNRQLAYASHGVFRYFGKFPPPVAAYLIAEYTTPGGLVVDPMCGSGTSGVEACLAGRPSLLNDVNPLSTLLAKVKTTPLPGEAMREAAARVIESYRPLTAEEYPFVPRALRNYDHWFLAETQDSLRGLKRAILDEPDPALRDFLNVAFAATVRRVSRATTQQGRLFLDAETAEPDALPFFRKKAEAAAAGIAALPAQPPAAEIRSFDLRESLPAPLEGAAELVILHPPYFNAYKYSSINSLELAWLGVEYSALRKQEVREFFKVGKEENAARYVEDMLPALSHAADVVRPGGVLALMIGDTVIHGGYIPVTRMLMERAGGLGLAVERIAARIPKYTEAAWVASQRRTAGNVGISQYDYILVMRKPA